MPTVTRRTFLATASLATAWPCARAQATAPLTSFFVVGDTHFRAQEEATAEMEPDSLLHTGGLVAALNRLPGTEVPAEAGGGAVPAVDGVIHVGDIVDSGDKNGRKYEEMQRTEWDAYTKAFGRDGGDGALKWPVFDLPGNHDSPSGRGQIIDRLVERNRGRKNLKAISANGLHCSWEWGGVHFVSLGLIVGTDKTVIRRRRYGAADSLDFLKEDLAAHTAKDQPLVVLHHVDMGRYMVEKPGADVTQWEWDPADVQAFYAAIAGRRAAIFYGHTHRREIFRWNGSSVQAPDGVAVFNVDNSAHFAGKAQAFFHVQIGGDGLLVREYATRDGWATGFWTPHVWRAAI